MSTIKRVITEYLGERCPDFNADCLCCKAWKEYDDLHIAGLREAAEMAFVDVETWHEKTGNPCRRIRDRILARIAELEKP